MEEKMTLLPPIDAMTLRRLGETADGGRDRAMKLVLVKPEYTYDIVTAEDADRHPEKYEPVADVAPTHTSTAKLPLVAFDRVAFIKDDKEIACCEAPTDALFWTDSAMEKFVFPYYAQLRIFPEQYLTGLMEDFRDDRIRQMIVAIQHRNPSRSERLELGPCSPPPESDRFGLAYLVPPDSDRPEYSWVSPQQCRQQYK
jgi:hypothetical protein